MWVCTKGQRQNVKFGLSEIIRRYHRKKKIEASNTVAQNFNPF